MSMRRLVMAIAAIGALGATAAQADPAYSTANVNLRAGPDTDFPSVGVIPEGDEISVQGCLRDESWCDVLWGRDRGWVYSEYIAFDYRGEMRPLPDVGVSFYHIPFITFAASDYWGRYYVGRPWWGERNRWFAYQVRPRAGWHAPPSGPRRDGWWRAGYIAPPGLHAPMDRGWRRPIRAQHRDMRRDDHRGGDHRGDDHRGGDHRGDDHRGGDHDDHDRGGQH
jgi:uncharacterized protein YraI